MKIRTSKWWIAPLLALAVVAILYWKIPNSGGIRPLTEQEAITAAEAQLAARFSGPRYFNHDVADPSDDSIRWISVNEAMSQVPRIAAERKLEPAATQTIERLIAKLSEDHPYRMVGGGRINLLRLNLSLDAIK